MSTFTPDNWEMSVGTWGTDAELLTTGGLSGPNVLRMIGSTSVATAMLGPWFSIESYRSYEVVAAVKSTRSVPTAMVTIEALTYDVSGTLVDTDVLYDAALPSTGWESAGGDFTANSTAVKARIKISKDTTSASGTYDVYWASVEPFLLESAWDVYKGGSVTLTAGNWTAVTFDETAFEVENATLTSSGGVVTGVYASIGGRYQINAAIRVGSLGAGKYIQLRAVPSAGGYTRYGARSYAVTAGDTLVATISTVVDVDAGGTISIEAFNGDTSDRSVNTTSAEECWFNGFRLHG